MKHIVRAKNVLVTKVSHFFSCHFGNNAEIPENWKEHELLTTTSLYGASSFSYAFTGIIMLVFFHKNYHIEPRIGVPIEYQAYAQFVQGFISFQADVVHFSSVTKWHTLDRILATLNAFLLASNMIYLNFFEGILWLIAAPAGLCCLLNSRLARSFDEKTSKSCVNAYARWHTVWHLFIPSLLLCWLTYREYDHLLIRTTTLAIILIASIGIYYYTFVNPYIFHINNIMN